MKGVARYPRMVVRVVSLCIFFCGYSGYGWANEGDSLPSLPRIPSGQATPPKIQQYNLPPLLTPLAPEGNPLITPQEGKDVEVTTRQALSLQDALALALETNRKLQAAREAIIAARQNLRQAQASFFPTLAVQSAVRGFSTAQSDVSNRAQRALAEDNRSGGSASGISLTWDAALQLGYTIYAGGQRRARVEQAEEQLRQAIYNELQVAQETQLNVSIAYYELQDADARINIAKSALRNATISLEDAQARFASGVGTKFAVLQAEVQLTNAEQQLVNAQRDREIAERSLAAILSLGNQAGILAKDKVKPNGQWELSLEDSIVLAWQQRPELIIPLSQRRFQEAQKQIALSGIRPNLSAFARAESLRFIASPNELEAGGFGFGYAFGLEFRWNLFDGGASIAGARQAEANIGIADINYANTRNQIRLEVERAFSAFKANEKNLESAVLAVEQADESLRLARLRFQAGVGTQTDVINQENALTQAQGNLVTVVLGYNRAIAQLEQAVGNVPFNLKGMLQPVDQVTSRIP